MTENEAKRNNSANSSYTKNIPHTETCEKCLYIKSRCKCNKSDANAGCIGINEAQEYLLNRYLVVGSPVNPPKEECEKHNAVMDMAIKALEEIQQYRAIGTVEEFKALKENKFFNFDSPVARIDKKSYDKAIDDFAERLKESLLNNWRHFLRTDSYGFDWITTDAVHTHIDELLKRMKGENE